MKKPRETREEKEARWDRERQEAWKALKEAMHAAHAEGCTSSKWSRSLVLHVNTGRGQPHITVYDYTCIACGAKVRA